LTEFLSCLMHGEWLPGVLHDTIISLKTLFVPAIAFFMGKMLMYMPLLTGGVKEMPAQEQER